MEKLIVVIVPSRLRKKLRNAVVKEGVRMTILESSGAFLGKKSATFLIASEAKKVSETLAIIRATCKRKSVFVADNVVDSSVGGVDMPLGAAGARMEIGGALVFVLDIEKSERI